MLRAPLFALAVTAAVLAAFAALRPAPEEPAALAQAEAAVAAPAAVPAVAAVVVEPPRQVRDVTPSGMTAGPLVTGALQRVEPPPEPVAETPPPEARTERIFNPVIPAAGVIALGDRQIRLDGIEAPPTDATCGAEAWPCGTMARAALRRFIRGRAVDCDVPAGASEIPEIAVCHLGTVNLARWLVAQGWAEATGEMLTGIEIGARDDGLGMWAETRPGAGAHDDLADAPASSPDSALAINEQVSSMP